MRPAPEDRVPEESQAPREQRDVIMQRVRVGVTGLAAVFLLTLLAASIFALLGQDDHGARLANGAPASAVANGSDDTPKEPLAELGVAPGANPPRPANSATAAAQPATTPPVAPAPSPAPTGASGNGAAPSLPPSAVPAPH